MSAARAGRPETQPLPDLFQSIEFKTSHQSVMAAHFRTPARVRQKREYHQRVRLQQTADHRPVRSRPAAQRYASREARSLAVTHHPRKEKRLRPLLQEVTATVHIHTTIKRQAAGSAPVSRITRRIHLAGGDGDGAAVLVRHPIPLRIPELEHWSRMRLNDWTTAAFPNARTSPSVLTLNCSASRLSLLPSLVHDDPAAG